MTVVRPHEGPIVMIFATINTVLKNQHTFSFILQFNVLYIRDGNLNIDSYSNNVEKIISIVSTVISIVHGTHNTELKNFILIGVFRSGI